MEETGWAALRAVLVDSYDELARRLTRRLRSQELAHDALQDTYLRLERGGALGPVKQPSHYLLRMATNLARDRQRAEKRLTAAVPLGTELDLADEALDPAQMAEVRSELAVVERALAKMPKRCRAILLASVQEGLSPRQLASRFDLSVRKINMELEIARRQCVIELRKSSK